MRTNFGHLHVHTMYSVLDGMGSIRELLQTAKDMGQEFIAITDHGSTSGLLEAQKLGQEIGIKVLLGVEFFYERENDGKNGHLIVIAKSDKGLENIFKLQEYSYVYNFYRKPRIKWEMLKQHKEGLIITSACMGSTFAQHILNGDMVSATAWARKFKDVFDDDFYIEIQANTLSEQATVNKASLRIAKQLDIKVVATNDVHYVYETDAFPHEVLLALQINKKMSDEKRWKFDVNDFWLKSEEEMFETLYGLSDVEKLEVLNNTSLIAEKCDASIKKGKYLPKYYNIPDGETERSLLVKKIMQGAREKGFAKNRDYMLEVQNEIDIIDRNGYSGYFLVVQDYVTTARRNGIIVGDGRGSGAGSKVAFLTDISRIEPSKYDLLFERFMADGRSPDFDVDFSNQEKVFEDLQQKYGVENVAHIGTFGKMTPKSVCRKVMSAFDHPSTVISHISKLIDTSSTMKEAYSISPELCTYKEKYKIEFEVIERLEGIISHEGTHAGGVIIYPNLSSILPIRTRGDDRTKRIVAFDKEMLEELGHYKFDILGLETLPTIKRTLDSIKEVEGIEIDLYSIDYEDRKVYEMLSSGDVSGVFQLNNQAQKVMEQKPENFRDLIAINALIRPSVGDWNEYIARRKGKVWEVHPHRMSYMEETVGTMTYQEQFLLDCKTFAGWDIAFADKKVRKNKNIREDAELHEKFITDSLARGYDIADVEGIWQEICDAVAGGYSFNKSHSASYAVISFQTAWLKCYYPKHFYASLMSSEDTNGNGQDIIAGYIAECKQQGINILPPDINNSSDVFTVTDEGIGYKITTIKHVGESAIQHIMELRPIKSFDDFIERREKKHIRKNVLINLIKAGCFDFDNPNRAELLWKVDMMDRTKTQIKENYECPKYEWNDKVKAEWEKEVLGMYLSLHPMEKYGFKPLESFAENSSALQGGEVYEVKEFKDKNKNDMAFVFINTLFGNVKVLVFASTWKYKNIQEQLQIGNIVMVKGKKSGDSIILDEVEVLE